MKLYIVLLLFVLFFPFVCGELVSDVSIEQYIPSEIYCNLPYSNLFKVSNLLYKETGEKIIVHTNYSIDYGSNISYGSFNKSINSYSRSNTGSLIADCSYGSVRVCGSAVGFVSLSGINISDNNSLNDDVCFNLSISNPLLQNCSVFLNFSLGDSVLNQSKQRLFFSISDTTFPYKIEYWIEDVWGNIVKSAHNSSNTNTKSYTPNIDSTDMFMGYIARARLAYIACNNSIPQKIISLPFFALGEIPDVSTFSINTLKEIYYEGQSVRIRVQGFKNSTRKTALYIKIYDRRRKKISDGATYYIPKKNSWFDVEYKYETLQCANYSYPLYIRVEGLDYMTEHRVDFKQKCERTKKKKEAVFLNESFLDISSFFSLQRKVKPDITLYTNIEADGFVSLRIYDLSSGFERYIQEFVQGKKKIEINFPIIVSANESSLDIIHRQFLLSATDAYGNIDIKSLHVNLSHNPVIQEEFSPTFNHMENDDDNLSVNTSVPLGYVTKSSIIYEDSGFLAIRLIPLLLFTAQLVFVLKGSKSMN